MILIANDLTHLIGSFGPREDLLFNKASILARELKVPRVCIETVIGSIATQNLTLNACICSSFRFTFRAIVVLASA